MDTVDRFQAETMNVLATVLRGARMAALLEFPNHQNAGDSLIYLGERAYLRQLGVEIGYVADVARYNPDELRRRAPSGPVLIQGGGNLGDTWVEIQKFRERVVAEFPDRQIIQLPQSINFEHQDNIECARAVFESHPDFTLMVRDRVSEKKAGLLFPQTPAVLCHDMAFGIGRQVVRRPTIGAVALLRQDLEKSAATDLLESAVDRSYDWGWAGFHGALWPIVKTPGRVARVSPEIGRRIYGLLEWEYDAIAKINLIDARRKLSIAHTVVTDRLHAGVLAALMGREAILVDNNYGKLRAIYQDQLCLFPTVQYAGTVERALEILGQSCYLDGAVSRKGGAA